VKKTPDKAELSYSLDHFQFHCYYHRGRGKTVVRREGKKEEMFKCCKKDDVGPAPVRLSSYR